MPFRGQILDAVFGNTRPDCWMHLGDSPEHAEGTFLEVKTVMDPGRLAQQAETLLTDIDAKYRTGPPVLPFILAADSTLHWSAARVIARLENIPPRMGRMRKPPYPDVRSRLAVRLAQAEARAEAESSAQTAGVSIAARASGPSDHSASQAAMGTPEIEALMDDAEAAR
jgi:hypothetical protein